MYNGRELKSLRGGDGDDRDRGRGHVRGRAPNPHLTFLFLRSPVHGS
jgi:hypothetical protein